jgi:uncharacterized membrane protein
MSFLKNTSCLEKSDSLLNTDKNPLTQKMQYAHKITLMGYWGLIFLIPIWHLLWFPSKTYSNQIISFFWLLPLTFPLFGLLKGKAYTHAWSGFIAVIYMCHGATALVTMNELIPSLLEIFFSTSFLMGGMFFARWRGIQLGLQLPKKK